MLFVSNLVGLLVYLNVILTPNKPDHHIVHFVIDIGKNCTALISILNYRTESAIFVTFNIHMIRFCYPDPRVKIPIRIPFTSVT